MSSLGPRRGGVISDINVTPLVDVVLVLLVIFMVVADLLAENPQGLGMTIPQASSGSSLDKAPLAVGIAPNGDYLLDGLEATEPQVIARVKAEVEKRGVGIEVLVSADANTPHKRFVALLDLLRAQGVLNLAIETVQPDGKP